MRLLESLALGPRTAPNRLVFGPHETNLGRGRAISERHVAYYRQRAVGGVGTIVVEQASVHDGDWPYERCPLASASLMGWSAVGEACHRFGSLVLAAIGHSGGQGSSAYNQAPLMAPSGVPDVSSREIPKWMERADIEAVVAGFGNAALLARRAGLDGVEINAGQYSLVRQFLSGLTNHRDDEWGADRLLFARQVLQAARAGAGEDRIVGVRLSCDELAPWAGIVPAEAVAIATSLAGIVDYVAIVRGSIYTVAATRPDGHVEPGFNLALARTLRASLRPSVSVVVQGSVVDVTQAEAAITEGLADAVEMTRAQIAEPALARKVEAGLLGRVRPCILCNQGCMVRDVRNPIVSCVVEPLAGHESGCESDSRAARGSESWDDTHGSGRAAGQGPRDRAGEPGPSPLRDRAGEPGPPPRQLPPVLVVGGGVAGLECARVAASSGRAVTVVERLPAVGGMVRIAARGAGRQRLALIADWLESECCTLGVTILRDHSMTPAGVRSFAGEVVICTGSRPGLRPFAVDDRAVVVTAADALGGAELPDGPIAVWDPIGGPIGISVAEALRAEGRPVTIITPDVIVGTELGRSGDLAPANVRLLRAGIDLEKRSILRMVDAGGAHVEDRFTGTGRTITAAAVVDAGHRLPEDTLWRATGACLARAGDALAPRSIAEAILEGRRRALELSGRPSAGEPAGGTGVDSGGEPAGRAGGGRRTAGGRR